jgi:hypothetical protein
VNRVHYPIASVVDRLGAEELPPDVEHSLRITGLLRASPEYGDVLTAQASQQLDPKDRTNAIHASMERTALRAIGTGSANVEAVLGIDPDKVAEAREKALAAKGTPKEGGKGSGPSAGSLQACLESLGQIAPTRAVASTNR